MLCPRNQLIRDLQEAVLLDLETQPLEEGAGSLFIFKTVLENINAGEGFNLPHAVFQGASGLSERTGRQWHVDVRRNPDAAEVLQERVNVTGQRRPLSMV